MLGLLETLGKAGSAPTSQALCTEILSPLLEKINLSTCPLPSSHHPYLDSSYL